MVAALLFIAFAIMFFGGAFVCFGEGMADTAGDGAAAVTAFVVAVIGFVGGIVMLIIWITQFFSWLFR